MAVHRDETQFQIKDPNAKHYLVLDALNGTTQYSTFFDLKGKPVTLNNQRNRGYLGLGNELKPNMIEVNSNLKNNRPNVQADEEDQNTCKYYVEDSTGKHLIYLYDKKESEDKLPTVELNIIFR